MSLGRRLLVWLVTTQVVIGFACCVLYLAATEGFAPTLVAQDRFVSLASQAVSVDTNGAATWRPTGALRAYLDDRPDFRFAIIDRASSRVLASNLDQPVPTSISEGRFETRSGEAIVRTSAVAGRSVSFLAIRNRADVIDLIDYVGAAAAKLAPVVLAFMLSTTAMGAIMIRRSLKHVVAIADEARKIDHTMLGSRLSLEGAPSELRPLISAFNTTLARLDASFAAQQRFLADAAHELRTPVAILSLRAEMLPPAPAVSSLKADIGRVQNTIEALLSLARLSRLHHQERSRVDLTDLTRQIAAARAPLAEAQNRHIRVIAPDMPVMIEASRQGVRAAIGNLLDNALRAEPEGGCVDVIVQRGGDIWIEDHGEGVSPEARTLMFQPFWSGAAENGGAGLGLAIVSEVAQAHGGFVRFEPTKGDSGARFIVSFGVAS